MRMLVVPRSAQLHEDSSMQLLKIDEVATQLGLSRITIQHWAYGHRPAPANFPSPIRIGRQLRFVDADIVGWIRGLRGESTKPTEPVPERRRRGRPRKSKDASPSSPAHSCSLQTGGAP
jgi:predicted DNA-binding transcriptional regulator AlpA